MSISNPPNYGSPDWQRGAYSAQKLLATVPNGTSQVTVQVPPNAETIVVLIPSPNSSNDNVSCVGVTSGIFYPVAAGGVKDPLTTLVWYVDVTSVIDTQVTISRLGAPNSKWYVYADAATHISAVPTQAGNEYGAQYVVPVVPSNLAGDHPPNEVHVSGAGFFANGQLVAPPGVGLRYRLFSAQLQSSAAGTTGYMTDSIVANAFIWSTNLAPAVMTYGPSGLPLSTNAGINVTFVGGAAEIFGVAVYTTEAV